MDSDRGSFRLAASAPGEVLLTINSTLSLQRAPFNDEGPLVELKPGAVIGPDDQRADEYVRSHSARFRDEKGTSSRGFAQGVPVSPAMRRGCASKASTPSIGCFAARAPSFTWPTSPVRPKSCAILWMGIGHVRPYSAQQRHGALHQTCLAHLARTSLTVWRRVNPVSFRLNFWFDRRAFHAGRDFRHRDANDEE